jgi:serine/threonine-protein kinase
MPLNAGTRVGAYEIISALGAGGMGEVYRARDTRLKRDVAIKVLPDSLACDVDRLARFEREAEILASLNHPHIAAIYGVEDAPADAGPHVHALVMELVEGETLAERLHRGPLPLTEALRIAAQMAEALEAAHERGVVHRDLKPANVKITPDENVKVLDFGLAKAMEREPAAANISASPTLSIMATQAGMILGTAAYMSPEQARGFPADQRSDIFSFGCVLYEMLTGHQAFQGETASDVLASVLAREPDLNALPPNLNPRLPELLKRCLEKNPKKRWQAVGDLRAEIETIVAAPHAAATTTAVVTRPEPRWRRLTFVGVPALVAGAAIAGAVTWFATRPVAPRVTRTAIANTGTAALTISNVDRDLAITPDGRHVVYVGNGGTQLFVRALDALEPVAIASGQLRGPFVSPDGQWVGFVDTSGAALEKVAITGGPPITLLRSDALLRGATWAVDDSVIFATGNPGTGLLRVSAAGGTPEVLTRPDRAQGEADHFWPEILPGGRAVLFTITSQTGGLDAAQVAVRDLRTGAQKVLVRGGSHGHYVASGHMVYVAAGALRAIPFDPNRLETHGTAVPVLARLAVTGTGAGDFAVATDGTLVYVDVPGNLGALGANARTLVWVDRTGKEESVAAPPRAYEQPRLSPDGTRLALSSFDQENDIWIWDLGRATLTRLTLEPGQDQFPLWTPDGRRIIFSANHDGQPNLWWQAADGTGAAERLTTSSNAQFLNGITPDGTAAVYNETSPAMGRDLFEVALDGTHRVTPLLQTKFDERNGIVSPDGRWLAYESNSSGPFEVDVRPFPNVGGGQWQVSTAGGRQPLWARSGKELFYFGSDGALMRVPVEASGVSWNAGAPMKLLEGRYYTGTGSGRAYDVSTDGRRFLMIKAPGGDSTASSPSVIVVQHFDEELKRLVPTR